MFKCSLSLFFFCLGNYTQAKETHGFLEIDLSPPTGEKKERPGLSSVVVFERSELTLLLILLFLLGGGFPALPLASHCFGIVGIRVQIVC